MAEEIDIGKLFDAPLPGGLTPANPAETPARIIPELLDASLPEGLTERGSAFIRLPATLFYHTRELIKDHTRTWRDVGSRLLDVTSEGISKKTPPPGGDVGRDPSLRSRTWFWSTLSPTERMEATERMSGLIEQGMEPDVARDAVYQSMIGERRGEIQKQAEAIETSEWLKMPEQYRQPVGVLETFAAGLGPAAAQIGGTLATTLLMPPVAGPANLASMWSWIYGQSERQLEEQGVDPKRAMKSAAINATIQAPIEYLGNLIGIKAILGATGWKRLVFGMFETMAGEGMEEYLQQYPDEIMTLWAMNPDLTRDEFAGLVKKKLPEINMNALVAGAYGAAIGATLAGGGGGVRLGVEYLVSSKQQAVLTSKLDRVASLLDKAEKAAEGLTPDEAGELRKLTGADEAMEVDQIVSDLRKHYLFQTAIETPVRERMVTGMESAGYKKEEVGAFFQILDGWVRQVAEREGKTPEDTYEDWFAGIEAARWEEYRAAIEGKVGQFQEAVTVGGTVHDQLQAAARQPLSPVGSRIKFIRFGKPTKMSIDYVTGRTLSGMSVYEIGETGASKSTVRAEFADRPDAYIGEGRVVGFGSDGEPLVSGYTARKATEAEAEKAEYYGLTRKGYLDAINKGREAGTVGGKAPWQKFKKWFGDSKVVDEQGKPLVVYHGTGTPVFEAFDTKGQAKRATGHWNAYLGAHFTETPDTASKFAEGLYSGKETGAVYPAHLSIKNPYGKTGEYVTGARRVKIEEQLGELRETYETLYKQAAAERSEILSKLDLGDAGEFNIEDVLDATKTTLDSQLENIDLEIKALEESLKKPGLLHEFELNDAALEHAKDIGIIPQNVGNLTMITIAEKRKVAKAFKNKLVEEGYDGISYYNAVGEEGFGSRTHIAFSPTQIKSIYNRGTFDPNDPRIMYQPGIAPLWHTKEMPLFQRKRRLGKKRKETIGGTPGAQKLSGAIKSGSARGISFAKSGMDPKAIDIEVRRRVGSEKNGDPITEVEERLKSEGWLLPGENLEDILTNRLEEALARLEKGPMDTGAVPITEDMEEDDNPPEGQYVNLTGEDLPENHEIVMVTSQGWDWVKVVEKDPFGAVLQDGTTFTVSPDELVSVLVDSLPADLAEKYRKQAEPAAPVVPISAAPVQVPVEPPRGMVENLFGRMPKLIKAFEGADASTPIHELGHISLEMLWQLRDSDYFLVGRWAGVDEDRLNLGTESWTVDELEKVARGFELYVMEGRAPTMRLRQAFERFRQWMLDIYRSLRRMNVELNPEIRAVFDRLLASDYEMSGDPLVEVRSWRNVADLNTPVDLSGTPVWDDILAEAQRRVLLAFSAKRTKQEDKFNKAVRKTARLRVNERKVYRAMDAVLAAGGLHPDFLNSEYGEDTRARLAKKRVALVSQNATADPTVLAMEHGYTSVDDMINDFLNAPSKKLARLDEEARIWNDHDAILAVENARIYKDVLDEALRIIEGMAGGPKVKTTKARVRKATGQVKDAEFGDLRTQIKLEARAAREAWNAGRKEEAAEQLENQRQKIKALKKKHQEQRERERLTKQAKALWQNKSMTPEFRDQIIQWLKPYFPIPDNALVQGPPPLMTFLDKWEAEWTFLVEAIRAEVAMAPQQRVSASGSRIPLKIEELRSVVGVARMIGYMAREEKFIKIGEAKLEFAQSITDLIAEVERHYGPVPGAVGVTLPSHRRPKYKLLNWYRALSDTSKQYIAEVSQPGFIFRALDGYEDSGPNQRIYIDILRAAGREMEKKQVVFEKLTALFEGRDRKWAQEKVQLPMGLIFHDAIKDETFDWITKEEVLMLALNSGNEGNRAALRHGLSLDADLPLTDAHIDAVVALLDAGEIKLVNDLWDLADSYWPELAALHLELTGERLEKVEGKYWPLMFDPELSLRVKKQEDRRDLMNLMNSAYLKPTVEAGHRIRRIGGKYAPLLAFSVISRHFDKVIRDVVYQVPVNNIQRVLGNESYKTAVQFALGEDVYEQLFPWLKRVADPRRTPLDSTEKFWRYLRKNSSVVALGAKMTTIMQQPLAIFGTIDELGVVATAEGVIQFCAAPSESWKFVMDSSVLMRNRMRSFDREVNQFAAQFDPAGTPLTDKFSRALFISMAITDLGVAVPSWLVAYKVGMKQFATEANPHEASVNYADQIIERTQATGALHALSTMQTGGKKQAELHYLGTMFYSYFAMYGNRLIEGAGKRRLGKINTFQLLVSHWWMTMLPALIGFLFFERRLPEGKEWVTMPVKYLAGGFPWVRDVVNFAVDRKFDYQITPVGRAVTVLGKAVHDPIKYMNDEKDIKDLIDTYIDFGGYWLPFNIPSAQLRTTTDGLLDILNGESSDPTRLLLRPPYEQRNNNRR